MSSRALLLVWASVMVPASAAEFPYEGVVTGTDVYVRSAPGNYPCIKLSHPARVKVVGGAFGWLKILPPPGCYSLIAKSYVQAEGKTGTVTGTRVNVRAGSALFPQRAEVVQTQLDRPAKVTILGEQVITLAGKPTAFYKIVPPPGAVLWISAKYVKRPEELVTTRPATPATGPTAAAAGHGVARTRPVATAPAVVSPSPAEQLRKDLAALEAVEALLKQELAKPADERDLSTVLARYKAIKLSPNSPLAPALKAQIESIEAHIRLKKDYQAAAETMAALTAKMEKLKLATQTAQMKLSAGQISKGYTAEGILAPSVLYDGGPFGKRYALKKSADSPALVAYVQCTTGLVDLAKHLGARVRVTGSARFDPTVGKQVVEVEELEVLSPAPPKSPEGLTPPPTPSTKPGSAAAGRGAPDKPVAPDKPTAAVESSAKPATSPKTAKPARTDKPSRAAGRLPMVEKTTPTSRPVDAREYD